MDGPGLSYASAAGRWVLAVSVLGSGIAALDATVVNIALPVIGRDFGTGVAALQWVMNGYTLTLAAFLLIGGSLGDRFGRRKVYLIGTVWFALASAACTRTHSPLDSGPRCSYRERSVPPEGCSPPSRSPTRPASTPALLRPSSACTAASTRLR